MCNLERTNLSSLALDIAFDVRAQQQGKKQ
jgi:hypothetical protein